MKPTVLHPSPQSPVSAPREPLRTRVITLMNGDTVWIENGVWVRQDKRTNEQFTAPRLSRPIPAIPGSGELSIIADLLELPYEFETLVVREAERAEIAEAARREPA